MLIPSGASSLAYSPVNSKKIGSLGLNSPKWL
jgi:hypothetical protein